MGACNSKEIIDYEQDFKFKLKNIIIPHREKVFETFRLSVPIFIQTNIISARMGIITEIDKKVVVKKLKKTLGMKKHFLKELQILKSLNHPNIITVYDFFQSKKYFYIIYPYFEGLPIIDYYIKNIKSFTLKKIKHFMQDLLRTINYLHSKGITHRNLDPKHIIYDGNQVLICGFAKAAYFDKEDIRKAEKGFYKMQMSNLYYLPPEVIKGNYDERNDIWVCGVIFFMLLTGNPPFIEESSKLLEKSILTEEMDIKKLKKQNIPKLAKDLVEQMLNKNYKKRPNCLNLLDHPFFKSIESDNWENNKLAVSSLCEFQKTTMILEKLKRLYFEKVLNFTEKDKLDKAFKTFDTNADGFISKTQMINCLHHYELFVSKEQVENIFKIYDTNGNNKLEYNEFMIALLDIQKLRQKKTYEEIFYCIDRESKNTGKLSLKTFYKVLGFQKGDLKVNKIVNAEIKKKNEITKENFVNIIDSVIKEYHKEDN